MDVDVKRESEPDCDSITKRIKGDNSSLALAGSTTVPRRSGEGEVNVLVVGSIDYVSLCISTCGKRAWARERSSTKLVYCDLHDAPPAWKVVKCGTCTGAFGMTRCGAHGEHIALQAHQTGLITLTDGAQECLSGFLVDQETPAFVSSVEHTEKDDMLALKAVAPVHRIGAVAVVEHVGLVFIAMVESFMAAGTCRVLYGAEPRSEAETGTSLEATISVQGHLVGVAEDSTVLIFNIATGDLQSKVEISGMAVGERVWQMELGISTICVSTPESILWFHTENNKWYCSPANAALACHANDTHQSVAMVTALGDVVAIDVHCRSPPKRLKQGSEVQPFASTHTRDGIAAWGGKFAHTLKLLKTGGEIHEVVFK